MTVNIKRKEAVMEKRPLYKVIAHALQARATCIEIGSIYWEKKWEEILTNHQENYLPSGSGIDSGCKIDIDQDYTGKSVTSFKIGSAYHVMDENGMYTEWIDFLVAVTPSLLFDIDLKIEGEFEDDDLKDYLYELFQNSLTEMVEE